MRRPQHPTRSPQPDDTVEYAEGPRASARADAARRRKYRRRRIGVAFAVVAVLVIAAGGIYVATLFARVSDNIAANIVERPDGAAVEIPDWNGPVNLLIMGSDTRADLTSGTYGDDDVEGSRSDTLMLLHVNAAHTDATLVSIPRDTMTARPECTYPDGSTSDAQDVAQINGAFDVGPFCTLDTVREMTGIDVDHFVVVNFDGFIDITNAVGGVDVCLAEPVSDPDSQLFLEAGPHTIQGAEALAFVRTRYGIGDGSDLGRIHTQQVYLSALARKVKSAGTLANPVALFNLADAATRSIQVDSGLSDTSTLVGLASTLATVDLGNMTLLQMPAEDYPEDTNRVQPSPEAETLWAALRADQPVRLGVSDAVVPEPGDDAADGGEGEADGGETTTAPETDATPATDPAVTLGPDVRGQTADNATCAGG
ncbi:LCP family protein [Microbacterium gorillae]|uniref:LCP family protein n=1 Tax=Microbacterium gorillae TaxID=1231063 RepID=UPI003D9866E6